MCFAKEQEGLNESHFSGVMAAVLEVFDVSRPGVASSWFGVVGVPPEGRRVVRPLSCGDTTQILQGLSELNGDKQVREGMHRH